MTNEHLELLASLLDVLIPPSADRGLPGAGELGLAGVFAEQAEMAGLLEAGLDALATALAAQGVAALSALPPDERRAVVEQLREAQPIFFNALLAQTLVAYYQDRRVMIGLGLEGRPPFPLGHPVAPTDFSILDPVRARAPFFRTP